jgi:hypothetical protein
MPSNMENIEKLTYAVTLLNNDADGMHELIQKESAHLDETIAIERRVSEGLDASIKELQKVTDLIPPRLESIDQATQDVTVKSSAALDATVEQIKSIRDEGLKTFDQMANSLGEHQESIERSFKSFEERSLKDAQEGRSEIQTDILNHKTAISARIDSLENEVLALKGTIQGFDEKISQTKEAVKAAQKPLLFIGVGLLALEVVSIVVTALV